MIKTIIQNKNTIVKLLVIGHTDWLSKLQQITNKLTINDHIQFISDIQQAKKRLWHNSYDILIIQQKFTKQNTIDLSKMAYAMFRPSIVVCDSPFKLLNYTLWQFFSKFSRKYKTFKEINKFTNFSQKEILYWIHYYHINKCDVDLITKEISGQFLYE